MFYKLYYILSYFRKKSNLAEFGRPRRHAPPVVFVVFGSEEAGLIGDEIVLCRKPFDVVDVVDVDVAVEVLLLNILPLGASRPDFDLLLSQPESLVFALLASYGCLFAMSVFGKSLGGLSNSDSASGISAFLGVVGDVVFASSS